MKQKLVRLKLTPGLLAHIELLELRQHLEAEVSGLKYDFGLDDADTMLDDLVFLLNSPLFLYAIGPPVQSANSHLHDSLNKATEDSQSMAIEARHLSIAVGHDGGGCFTQLRYGESVLIDTRELIRAVDPESVQRTQYRECVQWFCDEVEFLSYEYRAREEAAAATLGHGLMRNLRSKVVTLKGGKESLAALEGKKCGRVQKERWVKLKLRLWKDAVEG